MKVVLYISSAVVFLITVLTFIEENVSAEWRGVQVQFRQLLAARDAEAGDDEFPIELRQIYLPELNRVDRCVTCHVAIEDPRFVDQANPLKTHPGDYLETHDSEKIGCTVCHDGQGRAIVWADALGLEDSKHWEKPILPAPFIEANCYRCHSDTLVQTPHYNRGKRLFESSGCLGCHQRDSKGGYLAPEFRGLGDASFQLKHPTDSLRTELLKMFKRNRNVAYIYESVRFPAAQPANSVMIDYGFSHQDGLDIAVYLKSLTAPLPGVQRFPPPVQEALPLLAQGKKTYQLYCRACHGEDGAGGVQNPNYINDEIPQLDLIAERMFLFEKEDADTIIHAIERFGDLNQADPQPEVPRYGVVLAQYNAIRDVITNGNPAAKLAPEGPSPFNMPSWQRSMPMAEINAVIAYLISIYDFDEDEEDL
ncbi:MAG: c-type cytochrome [bacterium]